MWQQTSLLTGVSYEQRRTKVKECLHHMGMSLRAPFIYKCLTMRGVIELPSRTSDNEETVHGNAIDFPSRAMELPNETNDHQETRLSLIDIFNLRYDFLLPKQQSSIQTT